MPSHPSPLEIAMPHAAEPVSGEMRGPQDDGMLKTAREATNRIFFDTEFLEDGETIKLISIGMVREDGATFYAETEQAARLADSDDWLRANVAPHLKGGDAVLTGYRIAARLIEFVGPNPEFWAYYADYDWVVLCQLFGRMIDLPKGWPKFCRDVQQWRSELGNPDMPAQGDEHDALADALWARDAWMRLAELRSARPALPGPDEVLRYARQGAHDALLSGGRDVTCKFVLRGDCDDEFFVQCALRTLTLYLADHPEQPSAGTAPCCDPSAYDRGECRGHDCQALAAAPQPPEATAPETPVLGDVGVEDWRDDPSADERWNAGLDYGQTQLCEVLGVDPQSVSWDAATETLDGDVRAVIGNILTARFGDDWREALAAAPDQTPPRGRVTVDDEIATLRRVARDQFESAKRNASLLGESVASAKLFVLDEVEAALSRQSADAEPSAPTQPVGGVSVSVGEIAELQRLSDAATPGAWSVWRTPPDTGPFQQHCTITVEDQPGCERAIANLHFNTRADGAANTAFIVALVNAFRSGLLAHIAAPAVATEQARAAIDVLAERRRQVEAEGFTNEHDDRYTYGQLAAAAGCYAVRARFGSAYKDLSPDAWPWRQTWWRPSNQRRMLVKAGALILAEIERLDRAEPPVPASPTPVDREA